MQTMCVTQSTRLKKCLGVMVLDSVYKTTLCEAECGLTQDLNLIGDYWGWYNSRSYHHTGMVSTWCARTLTSSLQQEDPEPLNPILFVLSGVHQGLPPCLHDALPLEGSGRIGRHDQESDILAALSLLVVACRCPAGHTGLQHRATERRMRVVPEVLPTALGGEGLEAVSLPLCRSARPAAWCCPGGKAVQAVLRLVRGVAWRDVPEHEAFQIRLGEPCLAHR